VGIGQFIHICVNGKHLVHGLAHIRNEAVHVREVLELRVVLIIVDHAHYSRGNYGTFAVGPDRLGMVVLLDQKGYEFPDAVLRVVDSVLVHGVDYRLKRIVSVGLFRRIEVDDVDFVTKRFKKTVRIMIQFSFWVVCDNALSGKRKSAYRLQYQTS